MERYLRTCIGNCVIQGKKFKLDHHKLPYLVKLRNVAGFDVWLVDGEYVREHISEDFVNFDQHYHLNFIPKNEFWIDKANKHHEIKYYIDHLYIESRLMATGKSYTQAYAEAAMFEKRERAKSEIIKEIRKHKMPRDKLVMRVKKRILLKGKINVWLVDGSLVRSLFFLDYSGGGHDKIYPFIPENEIWMDDDLSERERKFIMLHEIHERILMAKGKSYAEAHKSATEVEDFCRNRPKSLKVYLRREKIELNNFSEINKKFEYYLQEESWSCGAAAFRMALAHFGIRKSEQELRVRMGTNKIAGTSHKNFIRAAESFNLMYISKSGGEISELKELIKKGWVVIVNHSPFLKEISLYSHYAIVAEISDKYVYCVDPDPPNERFPIFKFDKIWKDKHSKHWFIALKRNDARRS